MNKHRIVTVISILLAAVIVLAACSSQPEATVSPTSQVESTQPVSQPEEQVVTVADVLANPDGFHQATLKGEISEHIAGDKYRFRDVSGEIQLEIDSNVSTDPPLNQTVIISGDVEFDDGVIQLDVRILDVSQ